MSEYESSFTVFQLVHVNGAEVPATFFHAVVEFSTILYDTRFDHFTHQVITLTCTLTYACKYRKTGICFRDVVDQLLDQYGFTHTCTTEQTDLTTLSVWLDQVNYLDTCK